MENVSLSRPRNPDLAVSELQVSDFPKHLLDMLDAVSHARGDKSRRALVIDIVEAWAEKKAREWIVIDRVLGDAVVPAIPELIGRALLEQRS